MNINNLPKPKCEEFVEGFRMTLFKTSGETKVKTKVKTSDLILDLIKANRSIAREQTAKALNLTIDGIDWNIRKLKKEGKLKRIGPDRGGYWEVVE
jgi:ATP-dependent DNA helicase RecG